MSFLGNFFGSSALAPAVPASLPPGWQEITVDGKKMYVNRTTNEISSTPPPPPSSASLPHGWEQNTNEYGTYYAGPLTVMDETTTYRQDEFPTWEYRPKAVRLSSDWEVFSSNAKTKLYKNKKTNEITQNYPLAHGDDLQKILDDESAKVANESDSLAERMRASSGQYRGGLKNKSKRKQRKRKQRKRKQSKRK
jgi:hypothetical protein